MSKAKGTNLLHMRSFVERMYGHAAWRTVLDALSERDRGVVSALTPTGWFDLDTQHRLLRTIDRTLGEGDVRGRPEA